MKTYTLTIPGTPITKARPRITKGGFAYTPKETKNYETLVRELFFTQHGQILLNGPVGAVILAYFPIPKSASKRERALMATEQYPHTKAKDADNLAKSILDSLNGIAYHDDKQVSDLDVRKRYSEAPRVEVILAELDAEIKTHEDSTKGDQLCLQE